MERTCCLTAALGCILALWGCENGTTTMNDEELILAIRRAAAAGTSPQTIERDVGLPAAINTTRGNDRDWLRFASVQMAPEHSTGSLPKDDPSWEFVYWELSVESDIPKIVGVAWDKNDKAELFFGAIYPP